MTSPSIRINLHGIDTPPKVRLLRAGPETFAVLDFGVDVDIILPGQGVSAETYLRDLARALTDAANTLAVECAEQVEA